MSTDNRYTQTRLAHDLGLSSERVRQMKNMGMPVNSLAAAQAWRSARINIASRKDVRPPVAPAGARLAARATDLLSRAAVDLDAGCGITDMIPTLRSALAAVPPSERYRVGLPEQVMRVLLVQLLNQLPPREESPTMSCGSPIYVDGPMADDDAQEAGEFWYQVAAGELVFGEVVL